VFSVIAAADIELDTAACALLGVSPAGGWLRNG
jgi:hypothetical protein